MNFEKFKDAFLRKAKECGACKSEYDRAKKSKTIEELIEVIKDNLNYVKKHQIVTEDMIKDYEQPELFNVGKENAGLFNSGNLNSGNLNSGDRNSGDRNSGYRNSGYRNSGDRNSGDRNSGDRNSGDLNSGDRNSGYLNSGDRNSGYRNSGDRNSGYRNSGNRNSGYRNSGDLNSGDLNSGYRNSGVFCTRKREDTVPFFNKESSMTWDEWYSHPACNASLNLEITKWIIWDNMTDKEKADNPKAYICEGYVKIFSYHEAWKNLWEKLTDEQKGSFKTLPNFDSSIFKEITGIYL